MQCEDCGDSISLSNVYRDDDGNFVCEECHTDDQQQRQQRQSQTQSTQQQRAASASVEKQTDQDSSGGSSSAPAQRARTHHAEGEDGQAPIEGQPRERRFKTLLSIGKFISGAGWVIVGLGALAAIIGITSAMSQAGNRFGGGQVVLELVTGLGGGLWAAVTGILMVAYGQLISCFVAIERNTRSTFRLIQERRG